MDLVLFCFCVGNVRSNSVSFSVAEEYVLTLVVVSTVAFTHPTSVDRRAVLNSVYQRKGSLGKEKSKGERGDFPFRDRNTILNEATNEAVIAKLFSLSSQAS